jgi:hypothetical protein
MVLIPGWAFLAVTSLWRRFEVLQRWFLAIGISIAFYPILFYTVRTIFPNLRIGDTKLVLMLILMAGLIIWFMRKSWQEQFKLGKWGGMVLAVLGATLFTRLILAHQYPYPAWTDSLHHTLLTELVYKTGRLPNNLLPYAPTVLDQYHLGLYSLTGSLQLLADIPAHSALLWMAQTLNGLCGIGVFLFLDRKVSRLAGLAGMVFVGLLSFQPAWYVNWGRFTQIASQTTLLISALLTWETLEAWRKNQVEKKIHLYAYPIVAAILIASVFLIHFRVAGNLLPLLALIVFVEIIGAVQSKSHIKSTLLSTFLIIIITLLLIAPALIPALNVYIGNKTAATTELDTEESISLSDNPFYTPVNFYNTRMLGVRWWFIALSLLGASFGLRKNNRTLVIITLLWIVILFLEGNAYMFNVPLLTFTNAQEVIIMLYIPASILIGILINEIVAFSRKHSINWAEPVLIWTLMFAGFIGSYYRVSGIENSRFFMTNQDRDAMEWINENTPEDAVFAIQTYYWLINSHHGSDAGYWIPYFSNRQTTTDTMLASLGPEYDTVMERSNAVKSLYEEEPTIDELCTLGVDYIYDSSKEPFEEKEFDVDILAKLPDVEIVYESGGVSILRICD